MSGVPIPQVAPVAVDHIERHLKWRGLPVLQFGGILGLLLGIAMWPVFVPPPRVSGVPADPDVETAQRELAGRVEFPSEGLRVVSAITGPLAAVPAADLDRRLAEANALIDRARPRLGLDPRWQAASGSLDLVRHRYAHAARHYRRAIDVAPHYPEARIGLGVTLALEAQVERNTLVARRRLLQAIAQFAAVSPRDPEYDVALYDRILLLQRVGRADEARGRAAEYLARDGASEWATRVRAIGATAAARP